MTANYYDLAGGKEAMENLAAAFYRCVFADPIMIPLFLNPDDDHVGRMALWLAEFFGGPRDHTRQRGGFPTVVDVHLRLRISNEQREHWITHMVAACHEINLPETVIEWFTPHIYFGAQAAQRNSQF